MLRKITIALCFAAVIVSAVGCDAFRRLAGKPTSAEIAAKRELIIRKEAARMARLKLMEMEMTDSLPAVDTAAARRAASPSGSVRGIQVSGLRYRYYVVVGSFTNEANVAKMEAFAADKGYSTVRIPLENGSTAVGLCGTDSLSAAYASLGKVKGEDFCPDDAWVFVN